MVDPNQTVTAHDYYIPMPDGTITYVSRIGNEIVSIEENFPAVIYNRVPEPISTLNCTELLRLSR